ncbi:tape measure protein [Microbacterium sp.]|uniref:phage tail protein n=1 Tax=Microbacterium sp. TaxID=51671 RepID=UPI0032420495
MAGNVIGHATLNVVPSTKGFGSSLNGDLAGIGTSGGRAVGSAITSAMGAVFNTGMVAVGGAAAVALTKGFGRLEAIDTAQAKLAGLGHSAENITSIMKSATAAVKGTAFGLGDAASAAAQFSAAGIPLDGIERSLRVLASTSAVAGSSMGEMTTIFGKVAATGKLNGEVVQQLSERGVPILSLLSKQLGVTTADVSKMVSEGKVDFETFQATLEGSLGPAAQAMGESFSGMLSNVGAALGRLGANLEKPAFEALKTLFPGLISLLDQFGKAVAPLSALIAEGLNPAAERLAGWLSSISFDASTEGAFGFLLALGPLLPLLGGLLGLLGPIMSALPIVGGLFAGISGPAGIAAGALLMLTAIHPADLMAGFDELAQSFPGIIEKVASGAASMLPTILSRVVANAGIFVEGILNVFTALIPAIATAIPQLVTAFGAIIPQLVGILLHSVPLILTAALGLFQGIVQAIVTVLPQIVSTLVALLPQLATAILGMLPQIISSALELFMGVVQGIVQAVPVIITAVLDLLPVLISTLLGMLPNIIDSALELFLGIVTGLITALPQIITAVLGMLPQIVSTLLGMIPRLIDAAVRLFTGLVDALPIILPQLIEALIGLLPVMVSTLIGMVPTLLQAGVDLIGGLVSGLWKAAGSVASALLDIIGGAVDGFLSFLGIHSPSRLFRSFGEFTGEGFAIGIRSMAGDVSNAADSLADAATSSLSGFTVSPSLDVPDVAPANGRPGDFPGDEPGARGDSYPIHYYDYSSSTEDKAAKLARARAQQQAAMAAGARR